MNKILLVFLCTTFLYTNLVAQNVGIGLNHPLDLLHVNGITRTTGMRLVWELIPNTFALDPIPNYAIALTDNIGRVYSLKKLESGVYNELCIINYESIPGPKILNRLL